MKKIFTLFLMLSNIACFAQDSLYVRKMVNTLASASFWGRGYTKDGMKKTADFLSAAYKNIGLVPMGTDFKQEFAYPVNTFPGKMFVAVSYTHLTLPTNREV